MNKQFNSQHPTTANRSSTDPKTPKAQAPELSHDFDPSMDGRDPSLDGPSYSTQRPGQGEAIRDKLPKASQANGPGAGKAQSQAPNGGVGEQGSKASGQTGKIDTQAAKGAMSASKTEQSPKANPQSSKDTASPEGSKDHQGAIPHQQGQQKTKDGQGSKPMPQTQQGSKGAQGSQLGHGSNQANAQAPSVAGQGLDQRQAGSAWKSKDKQHAIAGSGDSKQAERAGSDAQAGHEIPRAQSAQAGKSSQGQGRQGKEPIGGGRDDDLSGSVESKPYADISAGASAKGHKAQASSRIPGRELLDERL